MQKPRVLQSLRGIRRRLLCLAVVGAVAVASVLAGPVPLGGNAWADSTIELIEETGEGSYAVITITMTTKLGESVIVVDKDGSTTTSTMSVEEYLALWDRLMALEVGALSNAQPQVRVVDQPLFKFRFANGSESKTFWAYGVDFLGDKRYREAAVAIIELAGRYGR